MSYSYGLYSYGATGPIGLCHIVMAYIVMVLQVPSVCVCTDAVAGVMHLDSFVPHTADDPVDLPADEGGLAYLGRIRRG